MITRKDWQDGWRSGHEAMNGNHEPLTVSDTAPTLPPYEHYIAEAKKTRKVVIWAGTLTTLDTTRSDGVTK